MAIVHEKPTCLFYNLVTRSCKMADKKSCPSPKGIGCKQYQSIYDLRDAQKIKAQHIVKNVPEDKREQAGKILIKDMHYTDALNCGRTKEIDEQIDLDDK